MTQELLNPRGTFHRVEHPIAPRPTTLNDKVMGLVDNSKANADIFLNYLQELISENHNIPEILRIRKPAGSVPAVFTKEFIERCDFVINAFGD